MFRMYRKGTRKMSTSATYVNTGLQCQRCGRIRLGRLYYYQWQWVCNDCYPRTFALTWCERN